MAVDASEECAPSGGQVKDVTRYVGEAVGALGLHEKVSLSVFAIEVVNGMMLKRSL